MDIKQNKSQKINVTIDGKVCEATTDDTILRIARNNGIYIPTMCYLTKVEPIASCRMCVVEVEGIEGAILSCQSRTTDGAVINTKSKYIDKQRQNIMKLYNVNHPLECGVCDKSGECELQNKTLEFNVNAQSFTTKDMFRPVENWGFVSYDPALCIMCEKCVRVANEITGNEALQINTGGYKSRILNVKKDFNDSSLGESAAVCPVGALVSTNFKYTSKAWELDKIPATCAHCSSGCSLYYEVKNDKIYRVTNDFEFSSLCGAGRFGFDFANENVNKDTQAFTNAITAFKEADTIRFSAIITNEEALILQKFKEKYKYRLVCDEAYGYQTFLKAFGNVSGENLYNANLKSLSNSKGIIVLGSRINDDNPMVKYHITMASKRNSARVAYMHPIEDGNISNIVTQFIKYEVGSEEGVTALLANALLQNKELPGSLRDFLNDLDIGNISAESNVGEEELSMLMQSLDKKEGFTLVVGSDLYNHPRAVQIAKLIGAIQKYSDFDVLLVPPATNALGIALICTLDDEVGKYTIGYNAVGDFELSCLGNGDLDMPALNQQEGTLTTIDKRVAPTNVALSYNGYTLNDIANTLGLNAKYTIDYTSMLPSKSGFKVMDFDELPFNFDMVGVEHRGYLLSTKSIKNIDTFEEIDEIPTYDGAIIYRCNEANQFNMLTNRTKAFDQNEVCLKGSAQFANAAKVKDGDEISYVVDGIRYKRKFKLDSSLKGTIALHPNYDIRLSSALVSSYRFSHLTLEQ
ncbi:MAG: 2Fe-2S iron-sulfur cluster-binding protein [Sulfurovaceae bacterium]|nr:2Fe-2S iron-sulfur cluster-binding protein [Sulfurovaceae bacterium]